jgi:hypothetical protein
MKLSPEKLEEIKNRAITATPSLIEKEPGWIIGKNLNPSASRVHSPQVGIVREGDYQLFLHAREDILNLLGHIEELEDKGDKHTRILSMSDIQNSYSG